MSLRRRMVTTTVVVILLGSLGEPLIADASPASAPTRAAFTLKLGDRSPEVVKLQQALIGAGIAVRGGADGIFGPATAAAVTVFQSARGLPATGVVDDATATALGLLAATPILQVGSRGAEVTKLQQALIAAGITPKGGADGIFGAGTQTALRTYQQQRGLPVTGFLEIATATALGLTGATPTPAPTPAPAPAPAPVPTVAGLPKLGDRTSTVTALQQALIAKGIAVRGGADGIFGQATKSAIVTFQQQTGLPATGVVDEPTAVALGLVAAAAPMRVGANGSKVADVQRQLIKVGITVRGGADGVFGPATAAAVTQFQTRAGLPTTGEVDAATAAALQRAATEVSTPVTTTIEVFPVGGKCWFGDTWMAPRSGGRRHEGVDIGAARGTPVFAVVTGTITRLSPDRVGSLGGNNLRLTAPNGTYFYYAHFDTFAEGLAIGAVVNAGDTIGYIGSTGNASIPHLHFEVHPAGGGPVNPYAIVKAVSTC